MANVRKPSTAHWMPWAEVIDHVERSTGGMSGAERIVHAHILNGDLHWIDLYTDREGRTKSCPMPPDVTFDPSGRQVFSRTWTREQRERGGGLHRVQVNPDDVRRLWPDVVVSAAGPTTGGNPRGAGPKQKYDRETILIEAMAYVWTNGLPVGLEELTHILQSELGDKMPKDTRAKEILRPFFQRMKQLHGR